MTVFKAIFTITGFSCNQVFAVASLSCQYFFFPFNSLANVKRWHADVLWNGSRLLYITSSWSTDSDHILCVTLKHSGKNRALDSTNWRVEFHSKFAILATLFNRDSEIHFSLVIRTEPGVPEKTQSPFPFSTKCFMYWMKLCFLVTLIGFQYEVIEFVNIVNFFYFNNNLFNGFVNCFSESPSWKKIKCGKTKQVIQIVFIRGEIILLY